MLPRPPETGPGSIIEHVFENRPSAAVRAGPPGWPEAVPLAGAPGWQVAAASWLLDLCPSEFRGYPSLRRHLVLLAWLADHHVEAQLVALRQAYRTIRVELTDHLPEGSIQQAMTDIELEGIRLRAARRGTRLIIEALRDGARAAP
jgi:hypothetical protein